MERLSSPQQKEAVKAFLERFALRYEDPVDVTYGMYQEGRLIATGSRLGAVLKMVAVDPLIQGQNVLATVISTLIKDAAQAGHSHLFLYTTLGTVEKFIPLGFKPVVRLKHTVMCEMGHDITTHLKAQAASLIINKPRGAIVINANPLTRGHAHLIDTLAHRHLGGLVFVVAEDHSVFPFEDRFQIVTAYAKKHPHVQVLSTGPYAVSKASFPSYFLTAAQVHQDEHARLDATLFKDYFMPIFHIERRYVGEEPYSPTTHAYNQALKAVLSDRLVIMPRIEHDAEAISASRVRQRLKTEPIEACEHLLPEVTLEYLRTERGGMILERLKTRHDRHS